MRGGGNCCGEKSKLSPIAPPRISLEIVKDITYIQYHDHDLTTSSWSDINHDYHHGHCVALNLAKNNKMYSIQKKVSMITLWCYYLHMELNDSAQEYTSHMSHSYITFQKTYCPQQFGILIAKNMSDFSGNYVNNPKII